MRRDQPSPNEITPDFRRDVSVGGWPRLCIKLGNKVIIFGRRKGYLDAVVVFRDRRQGNIGFFGTRQLVRSTTRPSQDRRQSSGHPLVFGKVAGRNAR